MEKLAAVSVTAAARFLEELAHRESSARLVGKGAGVPKLALTLQCMTRSQNSQQHVKRGKTRAVKGVTPSVPR